MTAPVERSVSSPAMSTSLRTAADIPPQAGHTLVGTATTSGPRVLAAFRHLDTGVGAASAIRNPDEVTALASVRAFVADLDGSVDGPVSDAEPRAVPQRRTGDGSVGRAAAAHDRDVQRTPWEPTGVRSDVAGTPSR